VDLEPVFLSVEEVKELHKLGVERHQPELGPYENHLWVRDEGLLESAVFAPQATFGGQFLHEDLYSMAAAYWHGLVVNHPFVDGNKRVGLATSSVFLRMNGYKLALSNAAAEGFTLEIADGRLKREDLPHLLKCTTVPLADSDMTRSGTIP
jgi:death-on-curing protein